MTILTGTIGLTLSMTAHAEDQVKKPAYPVEPTLSGKSKYNEYWEQYFIFEDGTLITSQFLVINFPFNKHRGIMLSNVVRPDGTTYIIKNGRKKGEWSTNPDKLDFRFSRSVDHYLRGTAPNYEMRLKNTTGQADLKMTSVLEPIDLGTYPGRKKSNMSSTIYAPHFEATGTFKPGPEVVPNDDAPMIDLGNAQGFGMHVRSDGQMDYLVDDWLRVFGLTDKNNPDAPQMILSSISRPKGQKDNMLRLRGKDGYLDSFTDIIVTVLEEKQDDRSTYPTKIRISADSDKGKLIGEIDFTKKLEHFRIDDHLSSLERTLYKIFPSVLRYRYLADYNLLYTTDQGTTKITGKALSEYANVLPPLTKKKKKFKRR